MPHQLPLTETSYWSGGVNSACRNLSSPSFKRLKSVMLETSFCRVFDSVFSTAPNVFYEAFDCFLVEPPQVHEKKIVLLKEKSPLAFTMESLLVLDVFLLRDQTKWNSSTLFIFNRENKNPQRQPTWGINILVHSNTVWLVICFSYRYMVPGSRLVLVIYFKGHDFQNVS